MPFVLKCPDCRGKFPWSATSEHPRFCPLCKYDMGEERADDDVVMPFIRSSATKANDAVFRQMEAGSIVRQEEAARLTGSSVEEMAGLKITDLNPTKHVGDIAAPPVNNEVSRFMEANKVGGFQGSNGVAYSGAVQTGSFANSGAKARTALQQHHSQITGGVGVSDRPALETQQPGYRRRG